MGCDIHLFVERREHEFAAWEAVGDRNDHYRGGRHYGLFGVLSGVRWTPPFDPIALAPGETAGSYCETNGLPEDVSEFVRAELEDDVDIHSRSHATLATLDAFNWAQEIEEPFYVTGADALNFSIYDWAWSPHEAYERHGNPNNGDLGPMVDIEWLGHEEFDKRVQTYVAAYKAMEKAGRYDRDEINLLRKAFGNVGCREWMVKVPLFTRFQAFLSTTIPLLRSLALGKPENVRLVWGFDN